MSSDQIIAAIHLPAGMFLVLAAVSGLAIFLKVFAHNYLSIYVRIQCICLIKCPGIY